MKQKSGFTLAEVLLTLAVIGIVAAITLPSLLVDTTEKAFDAQKRALHARLAQAIGMMSTLSGYGQYVEEVKNDDGSTKTEGKDDAAETFLYEGLSKVYKMNNICNSDNLDKCGIPASIITMAGDTMDFPKKLSELNPKLIEVDKALAGADASIKEDIMTVDTKAAAFETVNGESVAVFYNPRCKNNSGEVNTSKNASDVLHNWSYSQNFMCVNFVYDLNGTKGPNKTGKDIGFITALYAKNSEVVAPIPVETDLETPYGQQEAINACINHSDDTKLPNINEALSIFYNKNLVGNFADTTYITSTSISSASMFGAAFNNGNKSRLSRTDARNVRCIKK